MLRECTSYCDRYQDTSLCIPYGRCGHMSQSGGVSRLQRCKRRRSPVRFRCHWDAMFFLQMTSHTYNCDELTVMINFLKLDVFGGISSREEGVEEWIAGIRRTIHTYRTPNAGHPPVPVAAASSPNAGLPPVDASHLWGLTKGRISKSLVGY